jgi:uncharacterized protein YjbJ (UPF0337 family)
MSDTNQQQPGLIASHLQYVKGAAEVSPALLSLPSSPIPPRASSLTHTPQGVIGNVTGNAAWQQSGVSDKQGGIDAMKAASQNRDPATDGYGKVEEMAGKLSGCEGMEKEGAMSAKKD